MTITYNLKQSDIADESKQITVVETKPVTTTKLIVIK